MDVRISLKMNVLRFSSLQLPLYTMTFGVNRAFHCGNDWTSGNFNQLIWKIPGGGNGQFQW